VAWRRVAATHFSVSAVTLGGMKQELPAAQQFLRDPFGLNGIGATKSPRIAIRGLLRLN
jgi:hypothetical protein